MSRLQAEGSSMPREGSAEATLLEQRRRSSSGAADEEEWWEILSDTGSARSGATLLAWDSRRNSAYSVSVNG